MKNVTANGRLRHMFHGTYRAAIVLHFPDAASASAALATLGDAWTVHPSLNVALYWSGDKTALRACEDVLVAHGADKLAISSIRKSIDFGEPFTCKFEVADA